MIKCLKIDRYSTLGVYLLDEPAYSFDCAFFRLICLQDVGKERKQERKLCLTAKAFHRATMCIFLVGATEPEKRTLNMPFFINNSRCKRVQLRILG